MQIEDGLFTSFLFFVLNKVFSEKKKQFIGGLILMLSSELRVGGVPDTWQSINQSIKKTIRSYHTCSRLLLCFISFGRPYIRLSARGGISACYSKMSRSNKRDWVAAEERWEASAHERTVFLYPGRYIPFACLYSAFTRNLSYRGE